MREQDWKRELKILNDKLDKFGRKLSRLGTRSQLDRIEAIVTEIRDHLLNIRKEAVSLGTTLGPSVPEGETIPSTSRLSKGAISMNLVTSQTAGNKCKVELHPADSNNDPAPIDQTDKPVAATSSDDTTVSVSDLAADGLSFVLHFLKAGTASITIDADADLDAAEERHLIDTIDCTVVAAGRPEAATLGIVIGPSVAEGDPLP